MKKLLIIGALVACSAGAHAQSSGFGLGIMLGEPTGISGKAWIGGDRAIDFGLAWGGWGRGGYFHIHGDYLFHNYSLFNLSMGKMALHYGPGIRFRSWSGTRYWANGRYYDVDGGHARLGVRIPVGLTYMFDEAPVDVFLEAAPTLDLIPGTSFDLDAAIGARFYFSR